MIDETPILDETQKISNTIQSAKYVVNTPNGRIENIGDIYNIENLNIEILLGSQKETSKISDAIGFKSDRQILTSQVLVKTNPQKKIITLPLVELNNFEFDVVTIDHNRREIKRHKKAEYFLEDLENGVVLEMISIPGGKFTMGTSSEEEGSQENERYPHIVAIQPFLLGRYPITQMQWKFIANLPKVNRTLKTEPSRFKGDSFPVERVSWYDAQEFCERLSQNTGRKYRLPSEAEWEYACRARTSTPFHFGKIITNSLANYCDAEDTINSINRQCTNKVGSFPANPFGLYDMHGNVWEWCADHPHPDYQGAPSDGSVWLDDENEEYRILRGGSWRYYPNFCRSAFRFSEMASVTDSGIGFRVVCSLT